MKSAGYWLTHFFFVIGILFVGVLIHELTHHFLCGGDFIAGFYISDKQWGFGQTYCVGSNDSEFLPYLFSIGFLLTTFSVKIKHDLGNKPFKR